MWPEDGFSRAARRLGTGVRVDGLAVSEDEMLVGRTVSNSGTQRYRVGPNDLQLPVNQATGAVGGLREAEGAVGA